MSDQNQSRGAVALAIVAWVVPFVVMFLSAILIGLEIASVWVSPDWMFTLMAFACALLLPICFGMSITCFALRSHVHDARFRRYAVIGIAVNIVIVGLVALLVLTGQEAPSFIYAL